MSEVAVRLITSLTVFVCEGGDRLEFGCTCQTVARAAQHCSAMARRAIILCDYNIVIAGINCY